MKVLLHACCGPCLLEPFDSFAARHDVEVAFANPNIHPYAEYELRRDTLLAYARANEIPVRELDYDPARWMRAVAGSEDDPGKRCSRCFALRMLMVAEAAACDGFEAIATTLTVSPYQDADAIRDAGQSAAAKHGLVYLDEDFREQYPAATRRSRDLGMYRQNYCGCLLSDIEAREARANRRSRKRDG